MSGKSLGHQNSIPVATHVHATIQKNQSFPAQPVWARYLILLSVVETSFIAWIFPIKPSFLLLEIWRRWWRMNERKQPWLFCHEKTLVGKERNSCLGKDQGESPKDTLLSKGEHLDCLSQRPSHYKRRKTILKTRSLYNTHSKHQKWISSIIWNHKITFKRAH